MSIYLYGIFEEKIREILDEIAPIKKFQIINNFKPWVRDETKTLMEQRDSLRDTAKTTKIPADWKLYSTVRNQCTSRLKADRKKNYYKNVYEKLETEKDISSMHKLTNQQLGWTKEQLP